MTRIVQSFWTRPIFDNSSSKNRNDKLKGGWIDNTSHIMSWTLSCLQLRKYYDDVLLITDDFGKELLINILNLPYTTVNTGLNGLSSYHPDLWALGKIYSYGCQNKPFIHVDGDVYIFERFNSIIEKSLLVCQNFDIDQEDYYRILKDMDDNKFDFPEAIKIDRTIQKEVIAANAGIMGGNCLSFFKEFSEIAFGFVNDNMSKLATFNISSFNIIFEQYLFYTLAKYNNIVITPYFTIPETGETLTRNVLFYNTPIKYKYIHMLSYFKQNPILVDQMKNLLRTHHPDYYFKIKSILGDTIFNI